MCSSDLKTAFSELLPSNDPGVVTLTRTEKRMGDMSLLLIGVRSPDYAANLRYKYGLRLELATINGETSLLRYLNGALESVQTYVIDGEHITQIHVQRNPDKLERILQALH